MYKKIAICLLLLISLLFSLPLELKAADTQNTAPATGVDRLKQNLGKFAGQTGLQSKNQGDLIQMVANIINIVLGVLGIIAVIMILIAGFRWMTAAGNETTVKEAKDTMKNAAIGLVIIFAAYAITNFVINQLSGTSGMPSTVETRQQGGGLP